MNLRRLHKTDIFATARCAYHVHIGETLFLLLFLLQLLPLTAQGQTTSSSRDPVPESVAQTIDKVRGDVEPEFVVDLVSRANSLLEKDAFLRQFENGAGLKNAAQITQVGDRNLTVLTQYGKQNIASIRLQGDENRVEALQEGMGNRLGVSVLGSYNTIPVSQTGGAELSLELIDVNNLDLRPGIEQVGSGVPLMIQITPNATP